MPADKLYKYQTGTSSGEIKARDIRKAVHKVVDIHFALPRPGKQTVTLEIFVFQLKEVA
jgi:hypothetical protein